MVILTNISWTIVKECPSRYHNASHGPGKRPHSRNPNVLLKNHLEFVVTFRDVKLFSQMSDRDICHNPCPGGFCRIPCDDNFGCSPVTVTFWSLSRFWREEPESVTDLGILMSSISFLYMLSAPSAVCHPLVKLKTNLESNKSFEN